MTNMILFSHGKLANGLADSCQLIIGSHQFKTLNVLLDQPVQEIEDSLDNLIDSFETQEPIIIVTDIPGGSTTQTAIKQIEKNMKKNSKTKSVVEDIIKNIRDR